MQHGKALVKRLVVGRVQYDLKGLRIEFLLNSVLATAKVLVKPRTRTPCTYIKSKLLSLGTKQGNKLGHGTSVTPEE